MLCVAILIVPLTKLLMEKIYEQHCTHEDEQIIACLLFSLSLGGGGRVIWSIFLGIEMSLIA